MSNLKPPKLGPEPTLLSRREVDALYELLAAVAGALHQLEIPYILTGGSLLGAIRQHSILFCDDDIDLAILECHPDNKDNASNYFYEKAKSLLPSVLGHSFQYSVKPWEGGDKVRIKSCSNVFLDVFVIRKYDNIRELRNVIGVKKNGDAQSEEYVKGIVDVICKSMHNQGELCPLENKHGNELQLPCPIWHFNTRKAIELWPREVYRDCELFPTIHTLKMGPVVGLSGPRTPVWLLKRAFGNDCFEVYYQSTSHHCEGMASKSEKKGLAYGKAEEEKKANDNDNCISYEKNDSAGIPSPESKSKQSTNLPPLVGAGGQWTSNVKTPLSEQHYLPMQPMSRAKRRHTTHDKTNLYEYLGDQSNRERTWLLEAGILSGPHSPSGNAIPPSAGAREGRTIYMDGVFDLFHIGHLHAIEQCASLGTRVIIGVTGDDDATGYKRRPIICESERTAIIKSLKVVDDVVCPCPLVVTKEFMEEWGVDLVVHGFADPRDKERQREFFQYTMDEGKFQEIQYYSKLSTTDIIQRIQSEYGSSLVDGTACKEQASNQSMKNAANPKWFGTALAAATQKSADIPHSPFPLELRNVIEPQLRKSTKKRADALNAIREATGPRIYDDIMSQFQNSKFAEEGMIHFDTEQCKLREAFIKSCSLPSKIDLSQIHNHCGSSIKEEMMISFRSDPSYFQAVYDHFVRSVCAPFVASMAKEYGNENDPIDEIYYQSFPCVRVVQPGEFSIGPHADCAYGHHPCSLNFYVPLTQIGGSASLYLESKPGSEDWRPIEGNYGTIKHFAGAICSHWTPENHGDYTRVSLDFRLIYGSVFHALKCGGSKLGGVKDVYRLKEGYYSCCRAPEEDASDIIWTREGPLLPPDGRVGFPWTKTKLKSKYDR
mmetsp:Transcript_6444/g.12933  ORF Transcript_6444/g.12933 Transcript_6444/m.12933 type:complete len:885 (-) Transcript_6444:27-2681(-)